jgi:hypothetical protein
LGSKLALIQTRLLSTSGWIHSANQLESKGREKFEVVSIRSEQFRVLLDGVRGNEAIGS